MKKSLNLIMVVFLLTGLSSCLKEKTIIGPDSPGAINAVVEFKNPTPIGSSYLVTTPVYKFSADRVPSHEVTVEVNYTGLNGAPNDIKVKVKIDDAVAAKAIAEQKITNTIATSDLYKVSSLELTIPKGQRTASFNITYYPEKFNRVIYVLGFTIESISGTNAPISGNFGKIATFLGTKNEWDGLYTYNGVTSLGNAVNETAPLVTAGDYMVLGNLVNYYSNKVWYSIDPVTNEVTVSMETLLPIATLAGSYWDPETKTIYANWTSGGGGRTYKEVYKMQE